MALASLVVLLDFDHLQEFNFHLEKDYSGFRHDQMLQIQDFR